MPDDPMSSRKDRVVTIVRQILFPEAGGRALSPDDDLHDWGMTSLNMVNLMLAIEGGFGFVIPKTDLHPDNFRSVRAIESLVTRLTDA